MASVLLCEDERLGRQVAVKRLHADSPVDVEQRFNREAKLGASLNHPNLVSVFDTTTDDEGVLIVMEYVEGEPLSRILRRGPMRPEEVRRMVLDLGDALDHAHAQGVIHRDVKPANVLIRPDGMTKLADLGIATAADQTKITRSGIVLGTASYMAPEQLEGRRVGPATDIYALAAIAFEALSGRKPRQGTTPVEIAHKIATEGPPDLREAWPGAPRAAVDVLKRGMALDPDDRQGSAGELARELGDALEEDEISAPRTRRLGRGRSAAAAPAAAAAAALPASRARGRDGGGDGDDPTPAAAAAAPTGARRDSRAGRRRPNMLALILAIAIIALAAAAIIGSVMSGDDNGSSRSATGTPATPAKKKAKPKKEKKKKPARQEQQQVQQPAEPQASAPAAPSNGDESASYDPARGAQLNNQGYSLMSQGRYDEAVPVLQQAVNSFEPGTSDLNYAYSLFNLGKSLRLAGRPDEAIPVLEKRLRIPNQTETVQRELDLAKQQAGRE
jgi:eukaryotic-like serine/threonine-protein kinase